jgi:type I restriction enzyme S subunit
MSFKLSIGKMAFAGDDLYTNEAIIAIPKNNRYNLRFIFYYLLSYDWKNISAGKEKVKGATLNKSSIGSIKLPVLSLSEQHRIVSYLDSAFAKIDAVAKNAENSLNEAKALFQSALAKMMEPKEGWMETKLGNVCDIERGGSPRPIKEYITDDPNGLNWIKIGDTDKNGKYIYSTKEKIKPEGLKKSRWVEENDFLLSNSMSYGRPYILKTNGCIHDGWLVLRKYDATFVIDFLYYLLISSSVQSQFHEKAQGSTVSNLNSERVADVVVAFPDKSEQQKIVSTLDSIKSKVDQLQSNLSHTLAECEALKQAILRQTFE